jgi:predicted nuclease with TOPRIM domain
VTACKSPEHVPDQVERFDSVSVPSGHRATILDLDVVRAELERAIDFAG